MGNSAVDLLTFDEYTNWTRLKKDNKKVDKVQIALMITAASRQFSNAALGRKFLQTSRLFSFTGDGSQEQQLPEPPNDSETAIVMEYWQSPNWVTAGTDLYPRETDDAKGIVRLRDSYFGRGVRWRITYTGGYLVASVPEDIKMAVMQLVQRSLLRARGKEGVKSSSQGDQNITLNLDKANTEMIQKAANPYRVIYNL